MATLSDRDIEAIAQKIVADIQDGRPAVIPGASPAGSSGMSAAGMGIFDTVDEAVTAARASFTVFSALPLDHRNRIIANIRAVMREHKTALAKSAHEETGLGRFEDKIVKNELVIEKTLGTEALYPDARTGDHGLTLTEPAPYGVIGAITPCTNPTSTIINNSIGMLAAGNAVVFNVHPASKRCSMETIVLLNKAITGAGGPPNVVVGVGNPTVESAQELMKHPGVRILVVTGGGGVVKAAMASGKRAICAGPGNPPVVVDETANIEQAGRDIVLGASTDNNIICADEKEVVVVDSVADGLLKAMVQNGAALIEKSKLAALEQVMFNKMAGPRGHAEINRKWIGKNADLILREIGMSVPSTIRLGVVEVDVDHPLMWTEQMMPILPVARVRDADTAINLGLEMEGKCYHTAIMHSMHLGRLSRMARECNCSIFVKNGRSQAGLGLGGEGHTSFTIASPTGEGMTNPVSFSRWRRCTLVDHFRIV